MNKLYRNNFLNVILSKTRGYFFVVGSSVFNYVIICGWTQNKSFLFES